MQANLLHIVAGQFANRRIIVCTKLSDLAILEIALLPNLHRLYMSGLAKVTDVSILFLAEHTPGLTHLHLSGCHRVSLDAVHVVLRRLTRLERLGVNIPAMARVGTERFTDPEPPVCAYSDV